MTSEVLTIFVRAFDQATATIKKVQAVVENFSQKIKEMSKGMMPLLGLGLNMLFMGMALKRFFGSALREIFNTYIQIIDVNNQFFQRTQHLRAAWEFMKFALVDALSQSSLFIAMLDFVIGLVNWIGKFVAEHPAVAKFILAFMFFGLVLGAILVPLGMFVLLMTSLGGVGALAAFGVILGFLVAGALLFVIWTSNLSTFSKVLLTVLIIAGLLMLVGFGPLLVVIGVIIGLIVLWNSKLSLVWKILITIVGVLFLVGFLLALGVAPIILIGVAILALIAGIVLFKDEIWNAMKAAYTAIKTWLISALNWALEKVEAIINALRAAAGLKPTSIGRASIDSIPEPVAMQTPDVSSQNAGTLTKLKEMFGFKEGEGFGSFVDKMNEMIDIQKEANSMKKEEMDSFQDKTQQAYEDAIAKTGYVPMNITGI